MKNNDLSGAALSVILKNKGRSMLIVLALALGMGCALAMRAIGVGGEAQFGQSVGSGDPLEIIVAPGAGSAALNDAAIQSFQQISGVQGATGVISLPVQVSVGGYKAENLEITAVDPAALRGRLAFAAGGLFAAQSASPQIVLGYGAQMAFKYAHASQQPSNVSPQSGGAVPTPPPVNWLGQGAQVSLADAEQRDADNPDAQGRIYSGSISGVLKQDKSDRNDAAFMSLAAAKKMLRENYDEAKSLGSSPDSYAQAYVFAKDVGSVKAVEGAIAGMGFSAQSDVASLDGLMEERSLQRTVLAVIEAFSAAIAVLLLLCILLAGGRGERAKAGNSGARGGALLGFASLGLLGGLAAVLVACFFALIVNTSSAQTVVFGLQFGQSGNLIVPFGSALITLGASTAAAVFAGWAVGKT